MSTVRCDRKEKGAGTVGGSLGMTGEWPATHEREAAAAAVKQVFKGVAQEIHYEHIIRALGKGLQQRKPRGLM
jgi:hypothetical protein